MKISRILMLVALMCLSVSCKKEPKFIGIENVHVIDLKANELRLQLDYMVYNPNGVNSTLTSSAIDVYYKNELVGHGISVNEMALATKDTVKIPVECFINLPKLHAHYKELLSANAAVFLLKGKNKVKFFMGNQDLVVNEEITIDTKEIVNQEIKENFTNPENFKIASIGLKGLPSIGSSNFSLKIEMFNQLPLDYTIQSMDLSFYTTDKKEVLAQWELEEEILQKQFDSTTIEVQAKLNNLALLKQGKLAWLFTQKAKLKLMGIAVVKVDNYIFKVPIDDQIEIGI